MENTGPNSSSFVVRISRGCNKFGDVLPSNGASLYPPILLSEAMPNYTICVNNVTLFLNKRERRGTFLSE
jgi:hypothetical protein